MALFCYQAKKWVGAFAAALGGLDTLVFSAGIGERSASIRARICEGLGFLGINLQDERNALLVPPSDPGALAAALRRLLEDGVLAERLARTAWDDAPQWSWDARATRLRTLLEALP